MRREITRKGNNVKGFTLLEMMIVVAIIAVLVVISIPVFTGVLEKSREATDLANVRSAYAEVMIAAIQEDTSSMYYVQATNSYEKKVELTQKIHGWDISSEELVIGGISSSDTVHWIGTPTQNGTCTIIYNNEDGEVTLKWSGYIIAVGKQWNDHGGTLNIDTYESVSGQWKASAIEEYISAKVGQKLVVKEITKDRFPNMYKNISSGGRYEIGVYMCNENNKCIADTGGVKIDGNGTVEIDLDPNSAKYTYPALNGGVTDMKLGITFFKIVNGQNISTELSAEEAEELANIFTIE